MKVVFDPKPTRTFAMSIVYPVGWRHESPKETGKIRESLDYLIDVLRNFLKPWFLIRKVVDSEFSSVDVFGEFSETRPFFDVLRIVDSDSPDWFIERGVGIDFVVLSGPLKRSEVDELGSFEPIHKTKSSLKLYSKPRRFFSLKELTRIEKHFLVWIFATRGYEIFLEVSKRGDRIHYGSKVSPIRIEGIEEEIKRYKLEMLRRWETTLETVRTLAVFNVFSKKPITFDELIDSIESMRIPSLAKAISEMNSVFQRSP